MNPVSSFPLRLHHIETLENLIRLHRIHGGDPLEPVFLDGLTRQYTVKAAALHRNVAGFSTTSQHRGKRCGYIVYHRGLDAPRAISYKRAVIAHELAHIILEHTNGSLLETNSHQKLAAACWEERQADYTSAFLLVPLATLALTRSCSEEKIATLLCVPAKAVARRLEIVRACGR